MYGHCSTVQVVRFNSSHSKLVPEGQIFNLTIRRLWNVSLSELTP